jgi:hypothetical protein
MISAKDPFFGGPRAGSGVVGDGLAGAGLERDEEETRGFDRAVVTGAGFFTVVADVILPPRLDPLARKPLDTDGFEAFPLAEGDGLFSAELPVATGRADGREDAVESPCALRAKLVEEPSDCVVLATFVETRFKSSALRLKPDEGGCLMTWPAGDDVSPDISARRSPIGIMSGLMATQARDIVRIGR